VEKYEGPGKVDAQDHIQGDVKKAQSQLEREERRDPY
jgi:hypothetical protein